MIIFHDIGLSLLLFLVALIIIILGFKCLRWIIPLDLQKEIQNKNIAAAILAGAFLISLATIISNIFG